MKSKDFRIRDPFVLPFEGTYYMYGSTRLDTEEAFDVYTSKDLINWEGPFEVFAVQEGFWSDRNFWAAEVHRYNGAFYLFGTFKSETRNRGTQILRADSPYGPFVPHSDGPITPVDWGCLDGTLYIDDGGVPYMVFCREFDLLPNRNGTMCVVQLTQDLKEPVGEPVTLFAAKDPVWAHKDANLFVTDGPFLYKADDGSLLMLWASAPGLYAQVVSRSASSSIFGPWEHEEEVLYGENGGHGMLFHTFDGRLMLTMHQPNWNPPGEHVKFGEVICQNGKLQLCNKEDFDV